jgi:hypothetical protein
VIVQKNGSTKTEKRNCGNKRVQFTPAFAKAAATAIATAAAVASSAAFYASAANFLASSAAFSAAKSPLLIK